MTAKIFNIARSSLHDGNGIRTVVYMKGCTLHCQWCHNPESISPETEILFDKKRCIKCGRCVDICPNKNIIFLDNMIYKSDNCSFCMKCVGDCPNKALSSCGEDMTPKEVFAEIIKDKHYYKESNGGVTFSGGECLLFPTFLLELLKMCRNSGINTAVETALNVKWDSIEAVRNYIDTFIIDIKHYDSELHKQYTGSGNKLIISNFNNISRIHPSIIIRIPLIPNVNDTDDNLINTAKLINTFGNGIKIVELLKYNNLAASKYTALGIKPPVFADHEQSDGFMEQKCNLIKEYVRDTINVIY